MAPRSILFGKEKFLTELRDDLKTRRFEPLPVREKLIPKSGGKLRGLGIPTARDWPTRADAERLRDEAASVLAPMGLRLSEEKTMISHIDEGLDFLGMRIQRHKQRGANKRYVYTYPTRASLASVKAKVKAIVSPRTTYQSLDILIHRLNPVLRGWTNYHRHGAASKSFAYLGAYTWRRVWLWLRTKHPKATVRDLRRRYLNRWWPQLDGVVLFNPATVRIIRCRSLHREPPPHLIRGDYSRSSQR